MSKEIPEHFELVLEHQYWGDPAPGPMTPGFIVVDEDAWTGNESLNNLCAEEVCDGSVTVTMDKDTDGLYDPGLFTRRIACRAGKEACLLAVSAPKEIVTKVELAPRRTDDGDDE